MDVFDLSAKLSLDSSDYDRSLQEASSRAEQWATKFAMAGKAVSAVGRQIFGLAKQAVDSFASYQQLEGGIQTLFGTQGKSFEDWSKTFSESSDSMEDYIETARKVINGDFGSGAERKDLLAQAGYDPDTVQQMVNNLIKGIDAASGVSADTISANMQTAEEKYASLERAQARAMENARNAYETAGMSANDYMETVTSFAASLNQALSGDTEASVEKADMAIRDMSDNANKMGTDISAIQAAYQGFSKQNYTMLDNLKLGYGGTKTEMERLLKDAEKLTGVKYDINNLADVYDAIHAIQEETGITGTTAEEASETIEGSAKAMKASWSNVLTALITGGDYFDESIAGLTKSIKNFVKNIMPAFRGALYGIASLVSSLAPIISSELPALVEDLVPGFADAIIQIVASIMEALPGLLDALANTAPIVMNALSNFIPTIIDFLAEGIPQFASTGIRLLTSLVEGLANNIPTIVPQLTQAMIDIVDQLINIAETDGAGLANAGLTMLKSLADALVKAVPSVLTQVTQLVQDLTANIGAAADGEGDSFLTTATTILTNLVDGLMESVPTLIPELTSAVAEFIKQFADLAGKNTTELANSAITILNSLVTALGDAGTIQSVMTDITTAVMAIIDAIIGVITGLDVVTFANACVSIVTQLADGIVGAVSEITKKLPDLITKIVEWLTNPENLTGLLSAALTIFGQLVADVPGILLALTEGLLGIVDGIVDYFKTHGEDIKEGFKSGLTDAFTKFKNDITTWWSESGKPTFDKIGEKFKEFFLQFEWGETFLNFVKGIGDKISGLWDNAKEAFTGENGFIGKVKSWFSEFDLGTIISDFIQKIKDAIEGAWDSFKQWFQDKIGGLFSGIKVPNWIKKLFGKGEGNAEDTTQMDVEDETLVDMPSNMLTLDYSNLEPIPEDTLTSYQQLAEAILSINSAISGDEEGTGLNAALIGLPDLFANVLTAAQSLADYFSGDFVTAIDTLLLHLCMAATDEEGNVNAAKGNTLYTALGAVFVLFADILSTSTELAEHWKGDFINASLSMRTEAGNADGTLQSLAGTASGTAAQFLALSNSIYDTIDAYLALARVKNGGGKGGGNGRSEVELRAAGGPVRAGDSYIVGERGPEFFTPRRSGYIIPNEKLGGNQTNITVNLGNVYGESYLNTFVKTTLTGVIRKELKLAS